MHHTDYSTNHRQTQHKTIKNLSFQTPERPSNLLSAVLAALLVLLALFQMDPANAQTAPASHGFGTLQLDDVDNPIVARVIDSSIKMIVHDDTLTLIVDQRFSNPTTKRRAGEYVFAVPANAIVNTGHLSLGVHAQCQKPCSFNCYENTQIKSLESLHSERSGNALRITTPPIDATQTLHVYLNIEFPTEIDDQSRSPLLPYSDDFSDHNLDSVSAAAEVVNINASSNHKAGLQFMISDVVAGTGTLPISAPLPL